MGGLVDYFYILFEPMFFKQRFVTFFLCNYYQIWSKGFFLVSGSGASWIKKNSTGITNETFSIIFDWSKQISWVRLSFVTLPFYSSNLALFDNYLLFSLKNSLYQQQKKLAVITLECSYILFKFDNIIFLTRLFVQNY